MFTSIAGRAVVVTGGTRGIGKGIAAVFARNGARVLITGRDSDVARAAAQELTPRRWPRRGLVRPGRRGQPGGLQAGGRRSPGAAGRHRRAVRQRGDLPRRQARRHDRGDARPGARHQPEGHGVHRPGLPARRWRAPAAAGSSSPRRSPGRSPASPGWTHYGASKAGQLGFMRTAAIELAPSGITVNAVLPGNIATEGLADLGEDYAAGMAAADTAAPPRHRRRDRLRRAVLRHRRGGLHHRPDDRGGRRPGAARVASRPCEGKGSG